MARGPFGISGSRKVTVACLVHDDAWESLSRTELEFAEDTHAVRALWAAAPKAVALVRRGSGTSSRRRQPRWRLIASGVTTVEASEAVGVSWPVGSRWFRHAAACRRSVWTSPRAAVCRSLSVRRSRCCALRRSACARSPAGSDVTRGRSLVTCAGMPRPVPTGETIALWWRSGRRSRLRSVRKRRSSRLCICWPPLIEEGRDLSSSMSGILADSPYRLLSA